MSGATIERTVGAMTNSPHLHPLRTLFGIAVAALCALALSAPPGHAAGKTETLRFFAKDVSFTLTSADGTVLRGQPLPEVKPGDVLDVNSVLYRGNHRRHAARSTASSHLRCTFSTGAPDCESHVAVGGSLLVFRGNPGTLTNGTGRYQGATGRVISNEEVPGGSDVVAKMELRPRS